MNQRENKPSIPKQAEMMMTLSNRMKKIHFWEKITVVHHAEAMFLHHLCKPDEEIKPVALSKLTSHMRMQPAGISRLMKNMEKEGLILRTTDPENRRNTLVEPTEKGIQLAAECDEQVHAYWNKVFERVPDEDWDTLFRIWSEVMDSMETVLQEYDNPKK